MSQPFRLGQSSNHARGPARIRAWGGAVALVFAACRFSPTTTASPRAMLWPAEEHCWWAAYRTTWTPDSVASRFAHAFVRVGLSDGRQGMLGDTAWAQAGPTTLSDPARGGIYAARVVAIRRGDSTAFRIFLGVTADAEEGSGHRIEMCSDILRAGAVRAVVPRQQEADDSLPLWRRRR